MNNNDLIYQIAFVYNTMALWPTITSEKFNHKKLLLRIDSASERLVNWSNKNLNIMEIVEEIHEESNKGALWDRFQEILDNVSKSLTLVEKKRIMEDLSFIANSWSPDRQKDDKLLQFIAQVIEESEEESQSDDQNKENSNGSETDIELNYDKSNTKYYLSPETNPPYPGELFCRAYTNNVDKVELRRFKRLPNYADLFRKFTKEEVSSIVDKIKKTRTIPYLGFVNKILSSKYDIDLKSPFWFIPFVVMADKVGCMLYFEQNGFYGNIQDKDNIECAFNSDSIAGVNYSTGLHPKDHINKDNVSTIKIDAITGGYLTINEFHGKDYGSQLWIVKNIWDLWKEVVDYNRNEPLFMLNYKGAPSKVGFSNWEELLEWAEIKIFTKADQVDDRQDRAGNLAAQGVLHATNENWNEAEEFFSASIKLNPFYEIAYKYRGITRYNLKNFIGANEDYDKYIELNPNDSEAYRLRGNIKGILCKHKDAIKDFTKAISVGKDDDERSMAYYYKGYTEYELEEDNKAILDFDEAIRLNPEYAYAFYSRGVCKLRLNQKVNALKDLQSAADLGAEEANELIKEVGESDKSEHVTESDFCASNQGQVAGSQSLEKGLGNWEAFAREQGAKDPQKNAFLPIGKALHDLLIESLNENGKAFEIKYGDGTFSIAVPKDLSLSRKRTCARFGLLNMRKDKCYLESLYKKVEDKLPEGAFLHKKDDPTEYLYRFESLEDYKKVKEFIKLGIINSYNILSK